MGRSEGCTPHIPLTGSPLPQSTKGWSHTVRSKIIFFLLRARSYRAGCTEPPLMCVCTSHTRPQQVCTHTHHEAAHVH